MKLSISGRLWETKQGYTITLPEHIQIASQLGYAGIEVRYPLLPPEEEIASTQEHLRKVGIEAVFCFCAKIPHDEASWEDALRVAKTITSLGGNMMRVAVKEPEDLLKVRELAERIESLNLRILMHLHINTFCDSTSRCAEAIQTVDHPSVALLFDPAHLVLAGETDLIQATNQLLPWIGLINIQSVRRTEPTESQGSIRGYNDQWWEYIPAQEKGAIDFPLLLNHLRDSGYTGWLNVMPPTEPDEDAVATARGYFDLLAPWSS